MLITADDDKYDPIVYTRLWYLAGQFIVLMIIAIYIDYRMLHKFQSKETKPVQIKNRKQLDER
jgi:tellurite resistance protein TehA-like permease